MLAKIKSRRDRQHGKSEQGEDKTRAGAHRLVPEPGSQADRSQGQERPRGSDHQRAVHGERPEPHAERSQAAVLTRIVDCPKPKLIKYTCAPEEQASNREGENRAGAEDEVSENDCFPLQPKVATTARQNIDRAK